MKAYRLLGVRLDGQGPFLRESVAGSETAATRLYRVEAGDFIYSRLFAWRGAFGVIEPDLDGCFVSSEFPTFRPDPAQLQVHFLRYWFRLPSTLAGVEEKCSGSTPLTRNRFKEEFFLGLEIPLPPLSEQRRIVARVEEIAAQIEEARRLREQAIQEVKLLLGVRAAGIFEAIEIRLPIEEVADVRGGIQKSPYRVPGANPVRYLTVAHVQRDRVLTGDPRYFEVTQEELERWRLLTGDVLIIEGNGSAEQIGRTALFRGEIADCVHQNHVIRIRPQTGLSSEFLNCFLNSPAGRDAVQAQSRTTSGLRTLSVGRIKQIRVPIPSPSDQCRIIAELDALQSEVDHLKALQAETASELDALLPAILDRAFKGKL
jgi:type I restriction enzyme S subunit